MNILVLWFQEMIVNTAMSLIENNFSKVSRVSSLNAQSMLLVLLQSCFIKAGIHFKRSNVLRNDLVLIFTCKTLYYTL